MNRPRHAITNQREWTALSAFYEEAMADGKLDPAEHREMMDRLERGRHVAAVLNASDALSGAMGRSGDPEYLMDLARVYAAHVGKLPQ